MFPTDFWKKLRIYLWSLGIFTFLWVLAPSWQHFGCRFLCRSILWIDRSEPRFESHTGGKIRKTFKKRWRFSHFLLIFSFVQKFKNCFCRTFTDNARLKNVPCPRDFTRSHTIKRNDKKIPGKIGATDTTWDKSYSWH